MSLMACNALDYLVAVAMKLDVDAKEDGVYLKDGTRWQPTVNWAQIGPIIGKLNLGFDRVQNRYQPFIATRGGGAGTAGETHQVAACNYVMWHSSDITRDTPVPYERVRALDLEVRDEQFVKKYDLLKVDDIDRIQRINEIGVAAYLKESAKRHAEWYAACPEFLKSHCRDHAPGLIHTIITHYPELISVEAHAMGV